MPRPDSVRTSTFPACSGLCSSAWCVASEAAYGLQGSFLLCFLSGCSSTHLVLFPWGALPGVWPVFDFPILSAQHAVPLLTVAAAPRLLLLLCLRVLNPWQTWCVLGNFLLLLLLLLLPLTVTIVPTRAEPLADVVCARQLLQSQKGARGCLEAVWARAAAGPHIHVSHSLFVVYASVHPCTLMRAAYSCDPPLFGMHPRSLHCWLINGN